jgi:hypothetical protein
MRHLVLVGKVYRNTRKRTLAYRCAWCRAWHSVADYIAAHQDGAKVSHGMCDRCAQKFLDKMNAECPPPEAA